MNANHYRAASGRIFRGALGLSILAILGGLFSVVAAAVPSVEGGMVWARIVVPILMVCCYVYFFLGLGDLCKEFEGVTATNIRRIRAAAIFSIMGILLFLIPVMGVILYVILLEVAAVISLVSYGGLRCDGSFPGCQGMKTLYAASVLQIIGCVFLLIPLINIIGHIINVVAFVGVIMGWLRVMNAPLPAEGDDVQ